MGTFNGVTNSYLINSDNIPPAIQKYSLYAIGREGQKKNEPALDLNFAENKSLVDDISGNNLITFSRTSIGTYVDSDGLIKTSAVNLLTYSEEFDDPSWSKFASTVTANTVSAPDGSTTADSLIENTANSSHTVSKSVSVSSDTAYTFTVYAKANERSYIDLNVATVVNTTCIVRYTLSGTGSSTIRQGSPTPTHSITALPNGWYRCQITVTTTSAASGIFQISLAPDASSSPFYTGDGTSGIYIWGAQLEENSTVTTYIKTTNLPAGAPRFDHDPVTGESLGLLIEESRTNDAFYSNDFTQWVTTATGGVNPAPVLVPASGVSPSGLTDATEITYPAVSVANSYSIIYLRPGTSGNTQYVFSAYLKGTVGGETIYLMSTANGINWASQSFTLTTDWERCVFPHTTLGTNSYFQIGVDLRDGAQSGQPAQVISVWGAQVEAGSFSTSYIPTTGTTVTRAADIASIEGTNFSSWYNQSEGTWYGEVKKPYPTTQRLFEVGDSTTNQYSVSIRPSPTSTFFARYASGATTVNHSYPAKFAFADSVTDFQGCVNGTLSTLNSTGSSPTDNKLVIGGVITGTASDNSIARLTYWPRRLQDSTLQSLTS